MTSEALGGQHRRTLPTLRYRLPIVEASGPAGPVGRSRTPAHLVAGLLMFAIAIWLVVRNDMFRALEARAVTPLAAFVVGGRVDRVHDVVFFGLGTSRRFGLHLTDECTSALLLIPLLVMMGFFAIFARMSLGRQLVAVVSGALLILIVNLGRIVGIAYSTWQWGFNPGYEYSHVFIGSAFSLIGFVGAILLALWILVRGDRPVPAAALAAPAAAGLADSVTTATKGVEMTRTAEPQPQLDTTRAELDSLRAEFEAELTHLRNRFDRHLLAAQRTARDAETRAAAAEERLAALGEQAPTDAPAVSRSTPPRPSPLPAGRSDLPSPAELKAVLADVQRRIEALAARSGG